MIRGGAIALAAVIVGAALAGLGHGVALYVYVLVVGGAMLLLLVVRMGGARRTRPYRPVRHLEPADEPVAELGQLTSRIWSAQRDGFGLTTQLRPIVLQIARAQLSYGHGVDLDRQPERAQAVLGERTWELVRPEEKRRPARGGGWDLGELEELVTELERL